MRAGMEDERVRDAPRSRGLPGVRSREGGKPRMRCRVGWGVGMRMALGCWEHVDLVQRAWIDTEARCSLCTLTLDGDASRIP